jgi:hypothetical protein
MVPVPAEVSALRRPVGTTQRAVRGPRPKGTSPLHAEGSIGRNLLEKLPVSPIPPAYKAGSSLVHTVTYGEGAGETYLPVSRHQLAYARIHSYNVDLRPGLCPPPTPPALHHDLKIAYRLSALEERIVIEWLLGRELDRGSSLLGVSRDSSGALYADGEFYPILTSGRIEQYPAPEVITLAGYANYMANPGPSSKFIPTSSENALGLASRHFREAEEISQVWGTDTDLLRVLRHIISSMELRHLYREIATFAQERGLTRIAEAATERMERFARGGNQR